MDEKIRCKWCNLKNPLYVEYHDREWCKPNFDDKYLYEMLILESYQAGLSWECVLNKREAFRRAYDDFDIESVALYGEDKIAELTEKGKMDNTIWLLRYTSLLPPVILVAIMLTVGYRLGYVRVSSQIDKAIIIAVAMLFTYGVMLPYVWVKSGGIEGIINNTEKDVVLMLEQSVGWFCAQVLPFAMALGYHLVRASSEKKELSENEEEA